MNIYFVLDLIGTAIFAYAGAESAKKHGYHIIGVFFIATVAGIGGGSIRSLLLQEPSLFWISSNHYLIVIGLTVLYTMQPLGQINTRSFQFQLLDGFAFAVFVSIGFSIAIQHHQATHVAFAMGILTGTGGGLIRDAILCQAPLALTDRIYPFMMFGGTFGSLLSHQFGWQCWILALPAVIIVVFVNRAYQRNFEYSKATSA